jgi:uncharacterized damage-inducible protein DinB
MEPWMRGTHGELDPVRRAVVHALELAEEDVARWCEGLSEAEMFARPGGVAPVAFHLRHMARSLDRLLTYAERGYLERSEERGDEARGDREVRAGEAAVLSEEQLAGLRTEMDEGPAAEVLEEFREGLRRAKERVRAFLPEQFGEARGIGRKRLPTTVAGLLIHCAEHTQRHVGQAVTTAKIAASPGDGSPIR